MNHICIIIQTELSSFLMLKQLLAMVLKQELTMVLKCFK